MIYEIINPSDAVTIEAEDELVACVATLMIGHGKMGLRRYEDDVDVLPLFLFDDGTAFKQWCKDKDIEPGTFVEEHRPALADCLESAVCCDGRVRNSILAAMQKTGGDPKEALRAYNDERRSSLNDICGYAHELGAVYRKAHAARKEEKK